MFNNFAFLSLFHFRKVQAFYNIKYFGMTNANAHNFICHNMIFEKKYVREMVGLMKKNKIRQFKMYLADKFFNMEHGFFWREFTRRDLDYFSEYQLYGEYMIKNHPNEFKIRKNLWGDFPWHPEWFKKHPTHTQKMLKALRKGTTLKELWTWKR